MKNKLSDLNNHLFAALERLSAEELTPEQVEVEVTRSKAIVSVAGQITANADLQLKAARLFADFGDKVLPMLPQIGGGVAMKGRWIDYQPEELAWIEARKDWPRRDLHRAFCTFWARDDVSFDNFKALCTRMGLKTGRTGRIEKGAIPPNKGKKGYCAPGSEKGWFRPGSRSGKAAQLYQPIGAERVSKDGYLERKVHDGLPMQSRWRAVHLIRWEEVNGPVPAGHALKCQDGDRTNTDPANWKAIPRALLPLLAGRHGMAFDAAEPELKPVIETMARLRVAAGAARRRARA